MFFFQDVDVEDMDERTALHIAANVGATDVVSCLLMAKPNLDKVSTGTTTDSK